MEISIKYDRNDHQIRFLQRAIDLIEEHYGHFNYVQIAVDRAKKLLVFKPLEEEIEGAYSLSKRKSISSIELTKILKEISGHTGLCRYPALWHKGMNFAVVELNKGMQKSKG